MKKQFMVVTLAILFTLSIAGIFFTLGKLAERTTNTKSLFAKTDLLGEWSIYFDCPNTKISFQNDELTIQSCSGDYREEETATVPYSYEDNIITYELNGATKKLVIIEIQGETYLLPFDKYNNNSSPIFWKAEE